jgi:hypothetical protein
MASLAALLSAALVAAASAVPEGIDRGVMHIFDVATD